MAASRTSSTAGRRRPAGRTQAERRASSERKLLDAAAQVIGERGTASVSFADIAKAAGCSHGLPGYIFGSKTELLHALVEDVLRALREQTFDESINELRGLPALRQALRAFVESLAEPPPYTRAMYVLLGEAPGAPVRLRKALVAYQQRLRRLFRGMVADGIERGEIRPDLDPDEQAIILVGMGRGIGQQVVLDPTSVDAKSLASAVADSVTRSLAVDGWTG